MPAYFKVSGEIVAPSPKRYPSVVSGKSLSNTTIHNAYAAPPADPAKRLTLRNISLTQIHHFACSAHGTIFDSVSIRDLRGGGMAPSFLWGCAYRRTVLAGWIGGLMWRWYADLNDDQASLRIHTANVKFHESVDWALDITEADFSFYETLMGVPAHLVRRNPDKHFVMTRESATRFLKMKFGGVWYITAQNLLKSPLDDVVIVTGGRGDKLKERLADAKKLKKRGILS